MALRQHNFICLLAALLFLLFLLLAMPLIRDLTGMNYHDISELAFSVLLIISVWSLLGSQHGFLLAIGLVVLRITH